MPLLNMLVIVVVSLASFVCYHRADRAPHGRYLVEVMDQIDRHALRPVPRDKMYEAAINGIIHELAEKGDVHSQYISQKDVEQFRERLDRRIVGIGVVIEWDKKIKHVRVLRPVHGSPAYKAGIRAGDLVEAIDGVDTSELKDATDAAAKIKGQVGQPVTLTVRHPGEEKTVDVTIVRAEVKIPTILGDQRGEDGQWNFFLKDHPGIAYLQITDFADDTPGDLAAALDAARDAGLRALVIDLRENPGGLLDASVDICDMFLDEGQVIVTTRDRRGRIDQTRTAKSKDRYPGFPIAVLVNGNSASASEIVAACLQDHGRAVVFGERSYGKGTVQNVIPIEGGRSMLKLTTASYWRPSGKNIHRAPDDKDQDEWGVRPDDGFEVKLSDQQRRAWLEARYQRDNPGATFPEPEGKPLPEPKDPPGKDPGEAAKALVPWPQVDLQMMRAIKYLQGELGPSQPSRRAASMHPPIKPRPVVAEVVSGVVGVSHAHKAATGGRGSGEW